MKLLVSLCSICLIISTCFGQAKVHDALWVKKNGIKSITYFSQGFSQRSGTFLLEKKFLHEKDFYDVNGYFTKHEEDNL
ncbi:MAG: hypothetical protein HRT72_06200, partial [Flavobacteriales bacterium]|nr:hypothetical protein [Flavobacteriales bacterium]